MGASRAGSALEARLPPPTGRGRQGTSGRWSRCPRGGDRLIAAAGCRECRPCLPRTNGRGPRLCRTACDGRRFSLGARRRRRAVRGRVKGDALQPRKLAVLPDPRSGRLTRDADGERRRRACNRAGGRRAQCHAGRRARRAGLSGAGPTGNTNSAIVATVRAILRRTRPSLRGESTTQCSRQRTEAASGSGQCLRQQAFG